MHVMQLQQMRLMAERVPRSGKDGGHLADLPLLVRQVDLHPTSAPPNKEKNHANGFRDT